MESVLDQIRVVDEPFENLQDVDVGVEQSAGVEAGPVVRVLWFDQVLGLFIGTFTVQSTSGSFLPIRHGLA